MKFYFTPNAREIEDPNLGKYMMYIMKWSTEIIPAAALYFLKITVVIFFDAYSQNVNIKNTFSPVIWQERRPML